MGRNKRKTTWKEKREQAKKQNTHQQYPSHAFVLENKALEAYYKLQLKGEFENDSEFNRFLATIRQKLPVTFRINENVPNYKNFLEKIAHPDFIKNIATPVAGSTENKGEATEIAEEKPEETKKEENDEINYEALSEQVKLENMVWYPRKLVWQLSMFRNELKKNKMFERLHKFIQQAFDSGLITRQELVSMLPPLLLDVQSTDIIFDMCAAPGSKTSQLLELLYRDESANKGLTQGGVLANDVDESRANMLIHQVQRISTAGMMVVNHHAQHFPTLKADGEPVKLGEINRFYFDKILCDVPCTGDGAIRKIPKKWRTWSANDGICLHPLQLQILMRAVQLAKIGGLILYSTCSINPIEDEAVVAELFRRANSDAFELVDIEPLVPGLKIRRGIFHWTVSEPKAKNMEEEKESADATATEKSNAKPEDFFTTYESIDQVPKDYTGLVRSTMFPDTLEKMRDVYKIQNTARIMPHDQNTGGFYLALIRKKNHVVFGGKGEKVPKAPTEEQKTQQVAAPQAETTAMQQEDEDEKAIKELDKDVNEKEALKRALEEDDGENVAVDTKEAEGETEEKGKQQKRGKKNKVEVKKPLFLELEQKEWESIKDYYGFSDQIKDLLIQQSLGDKRVVMISPGVKKILDLDRGKGAIVKLNMGVKAFSRNKASFKEQNCPYRICQDAALSLFPFMSSKKIKCSAEDFKFFVQSPSIKYEEIQNEELRKQIQSTGQGAVVLYAEKDGIIQDLDVLACLTHATSITPMASRELIGSFKLRYFDV